jgi:D-tyrosyl-tRNA(Tyr) deacylase
MRAIVQRVDSASVVCDGVFKDKINQGFVVFIGFKVGDDRKNIEKLARKISTLRIFKDNEDKLNLSLKDVDGEVLVISNFTIYADAISCNRPSLFNSMKQDEAREFYNEFLEKLENFLPGKVKCGIFHSHMDVNVQNDGPLNIILEY